MNNTFRHSSFLVCQNQWALLRQNLLISLCWFIFSLPVSSQILINEVCSDNESIVQDQYGEFSDWIELYNSTDDPLSLEGFSISDKNESEQGWIFPAIEIGPSEHLLIFASDRDQKTGELHCPFKLSKDGESLFLWDEEGLLVDQLTIPQLSADDSYGRSPDGGVNFALFYTPSPGSINGGLFQEIPLAPAIINEQNFYAEPFQLLLECPQQDCFIRYTTDGSLPTDTAKIYQAPVLMEQTTTIRCAAFLPNSLPSAVLTRTFFVNSPHSLPVVALTMSPELLFDEETGIFKRGPNAEPEYPYYGANYWSEEELPAYIEFFTADQKREIEFPIGAKVHGGTVARTRAQKPIRLVARAEFGTDKIVYPFFPEKEVDTFKRLILRNASGDFNVGHMRDGLIQRHCQRQGLDIDTQGFVPMAYYVNGRYWGIIHLREKVDEHYLRYNYGVEIDQIDFLEQDTFLLEGSFAHFDSMEVYASSQDLSNDLNFALIEENFDLPSLVDYFFVQTVINNSDWPKNNLKLWRERKAGAKWRYMLFDLDAGMGRYGWTSFNADGWKRMMEKTEVRHVRLLHDFLENKNFRHYLLNRSADLLNTAFHPEIFQEEIKNTADEMASEMERHLDRWDGDYNYWQGEEIPRLLEYVEERPDFARQYLVDYFALEGTVELELNTYPKNAGSIKINTIEVKDLPWSGTYFNGIPVELSILPNPGYTFSHWQSLQTFPQQEKGFSIKHALTTDDQITAVFKETETSKEFLLFPNPAQDHLNLYFELSQISEIQISIFDVAGKTVKRIPLGWRNVGPQEFGFAVEELPKGIYLLRLEGLEESKVLRFVKS